MVALKPSTGAQCAPVRSGVMDDPMMKGEYIMVTKDMLIAEIIQMNEAYVNILLEAGMHCISCPAAMAETLEEACMVHGIDVDSVVEELNKIK